jgi:hypothetical protein
MLTIARILGVNHSEISKHHFGKAYPLRMRERQTPGTHGHRNTRQKEGIVQGHLLATNIPADGILGGMSFSQSVIRRCALPLRSNEECLQPTPHGGL